MLQADDDRWPYWGEEFDSDEPGNETSEPKKDSVGQGPAVSDAKAKPQKQPGATNQSFSDAMKLASLGTELFGAVLAGTLLGWAVSWLVGLLTGSRPTWIIAVGVFVGAIAGFFNMYRVVVEEGKKEEQRKSGSSK